MSFWTEKTVEPKRSFRWLLYVSGMPQFIVKTVKKPSFSVGTTPHQFLNYEFHYPGVVKWQPMSFTIVDPVKPDSTKSLYRLLEQSGYVIPSFYQQNEATTISKQKMVDALGGEIKLSQLDADGARAIETWVIKNPLITSVDFGELSYASEEMLNITVNLTYDYATIEGLDNRGPGLAGDQFWDLNTKVAEGGELAGDNVGPRVGQKAPPGIYGK